MLKKQNVTVPSRAHRLVALFASVLLATLFISLPEFNGSTAAQAATRSPVVVSLTFDDGTADHVQAAALMEKHGVRGTFYVNSSRLGAAGRLTTANAVKMQQDGHEIGGHTVTHADLPTLTPEEQARQVCNDRVTLMKAGLKATTFAYPYGDQNAGVQQVTKNCGYNAARGVGGIVSPGTCKGCPYAEKIPPTNGFDIRTPDSVKPSTTLEMMENYVLQAEQNNGGWVVLVLHRVCDNCDPYAANPQMLDQFLSWLSERAADGTTVKTVHQVIGGEEKPPVNGPPPAPRQAMAEMLENTSMESDSNGDGVPNCWQRGGFGDNSYSWAKASSPHSGSVAQQVTITRFVNGDRRIMTPQDLGACAPGTVARHTYKATAWYRTNGATRLVAYYRDANNRWIYLSQSAALPTSPTDWKQAIWTTPPLPDGSTALSIGLSLRSVGVLAGDDFSLTDTDQTLPKVEITSPDDGDRVRGTVTFKAEASDTSGIHHVDFMVDGKVVCTSTVAPFECQYDTTVAPDSVIAVTARAVDTANNVALSEGRNYTVSNSMPLDALPPSVALTAPGQGDTLSREVTMTATASDNDAVSRVLFYVGLELVGSAKTAPYTFVWDSRTVPEGPVVLTAKALDRSGNLGMSTPVMALVNNRIFDSTAPASTATCNGAACGTGWYKAAVKVALAATDDSSGVARIVYTTDGSEPTSTSGTPYTAPFDVATSRTVKYRAWDNAGNAEEVRSLALKIDTVAPTAKVLAPLNGASVTGIVYIKAEVADANGIARVYFYLDGKSLGSRTVTPYQWKWDTGPVADGNHTLQVAAVDPAGNLTKSALVTVKVT